MALHERSVRLTSPGCRPAGSRLRFAGEAPSPDRAEHPGAPDLVVEILSESTWRSDEGPKLALYERFGVREYWLANPFLKTVTVFRLENGRFRRIAELSAQAGDFLSTPLLLGLEIDLSAVFS